MAGDPAVSAEAVRVKVDHRLARLERGQAALVMRIASLERLQAEDRLWHTSVDAKLAEVLAIISPAATFVRGLGRARRWMIALSAVIGASVILLNASVGLLHALNP